jgi:S-formylglutathione hydrolase FrmB
MEISLKGSGFVTLFLAGLILLFMGLSGCEHEVSPPDEPDPFVRLLKGQTYQSKILHRSMNFAVLLPQEYENSTDSFPVVYLLHGYGDDESAWYQWGSIQYYVDKYAAETVPAIYVMPEAFNSYYVNKYNGNYPMMDVLVTELVPAVDSMFRTIKDASGRAVMGYSMGGYGAMILPAKNPDVFKTGVVLSMSFRTDSQYVAEPQDVFDYQWGPVFGGIGSSGSARFTDYFLANSPFHFFGDPGSQSFAGLNFFIDCGDDEETLSETNGELHNLLRDLDYPHEYRMRNGGHSWSYWQRSLHEALVYISDAFRQVPYSADPAPVDPGPFIPPDCYITEQLEGTTINFRVALPPDYSTGTDSYPFIIVLHDRGTIDQENRSQMMVAILEKNMSAYKLPLSLIIEVPVQAETITAGRIFDLIGQVRDHYRVFDTRGVMIGNGQGGRQAYDVMPSCSGPVLGCLLFDANLPDHAEVNLSDLDYYLDICDEGINYKSYHSLYLSFRQNGMGHQYRVRQGTPSYQSFLNGLDEASVYIKDHLLK